MARLEGKNILMIIPKDYYDEKQLDIPMEIFKNEGADVRVASEKFKEAVGMNGGRCMPDTLIVDAMEGIIGDSYVTAGKGTRQIKGVYHGTVLVGGKGARKYLWNNKLVRLIVTDRYQCQMVVGAFGTAVPVLGEADLIRNVEVAAEQNKHTLPELEKYAAIVTDEAVCVYDRLVTARDGDAAEEFAEEMIEMVKNTKLK